MAKVVTASRSVIEKGVSAAKVALITGGTSGIGAATARRMAELGTKVVITGRRHREGRLLVSAQRGMCGILPGRSQPTRRSTLHCAIYNRNLWAFGLCIQQRGNIG